MYGLREGAKGARRSDSEGVADWLVLFVISSCKCLSWYPHRLACHRQGISFASRLACHRQGISFASRLAVARLGLGTASRFRLLAKYRSGVRFPSQSSALACGQNFVLTPPGIEPGFEA